MVFQAQGHNECCPTTLAMLAGVSKGEVIAAAARIVGYGPSASWEALRGSVSWEALRGCLCRHEIQQLVQRLVERFLPAVADAAGFSNRIAFGSIAVTSTTELSRVPRKGRGAVTIHWPNVRAHVMPYENGRVLDPDGPGVPETMTQVFKRLGGQWRICRITPTEFKKEG